MPPIFLHLRFLQIPLALSLLGVAHAAAQSLPGSKPLISYQRPDQPTPAVEVSQQIRQDHAVRAAGLETAPTEKTPVPFSQTANQPSDPRQLAPQSRFATNLGSEKPTGHGRDVTNLAIPHIESLTTAGTGLAIVMGLFFVCMWLMRRSGPKPTTPLPKDAVAVLGRVPLAARNFAHLIQVGNKLVLVAITPDGATPITEVTDPGEVDRLLGLCLRKHKHSTTAEFHNVLQQLANEPAKGFLGNEAHAMTAGLRR